MAFSTCLALGLFCAGGALALLLADNQWAKNHAWLLPILYGGTAFFALAAIASARWFRKLLVPQEAVNQEATKQEIHGSSVSGDLRMAGRDYTETHIHSDPLLQARLTEFDQIDSFIVKKDEISLRETFDLPEMLRFNIRMARHFHWPQSVPADEMEEAALFFKGGKAVIVKDCLDHHRVGDSLYMKGKPGKIFSANISKKCVDARATLLSLSSSSKLPMAVAIAIKELDQTVENNIEMMVTALNECFAMNQRSIRENDEIGSDRQGAAWNHYWRRFTHLKPKADVVSLAIRAALENK